MLDKCYVYKAFLISSSSRATTIRDRSLHVRFIFDNVLIAYKISFFLELLLNLYTLLATCRQTC